MYTASKEISCQCIWFLAYYFNILSISKIFGVCFGIFHKYYFIQHKIFFFILYNTPAISIVGRWSVASEAITGLGCVSASLRQSCRSSLESIQYHSLVYMLNCSPNKCHQSIARINHCDISMVVSVNYNTVHVLNAFIPKWNTKMQLAPPPPPNNSCI